VGGRRSAITAVLDSGGNCSSRFVTPDNPDRCSASAPAVDASTTTDTAVRKESTGVMVTGSAVLPAVAWRLLTSSGAAGRGWMVAMAHTRSLGSEWIPEMATRDAAAGAAASMGSPPSGSAPRAGSTRATAAASLRSGIELSPERS
jgi:hypothetical protein